MENKTTKKRTNGEQLAIDQILLAKIKKQMLKDVRGMFKEYEQTLDGEMLRQELMYFSASVLHLTAHGVYNGRETWFADARDIAARILHDARSRQTDP